MIKKFKQLLKTVVSKSEEPIKPIEDKKIECTIDENLVDCESEAFKQDALNYYTGVPAPVYLEDDEWFGSAPVRSQKQIDYMVQETEIKRQEFEKSFSIESEDIHQKMYEIATASQSTTLHLNPPGGSENFQGGSENVHR